MEVFRTKQTVLECHVNDPKAPVIWFKDGIPIDVSLIAFPRTYVLSIRIDFVSFIGLYKL